MMGKKIRKKPLGRCVASGKIINGRNVIIADIETIKTYLIQHGYNVFLMKQRKLEIVSALVGFMLIVNILFSLV